MDSYLSYLIYNTVVVLIYFPTATVILIRSRKTLDIPAKVVILLYMICGILRISYLSEEYERQRKQS